MSKMTIESIGSAISGGNMEEMYSHGRTVRMDPPQAPEPTGSVQHAGDTGSFMEMLKDGMDKVNNVQREADHAIKEAVAGRNKNLHETMLLIEKADMTYKFAMQVRNKILDAYREIMKMQV